MSKYYANWQEFILFILSFIQRLPLMGFYFVTSLVFYFIYMISRSKNVLRVYFKYGIKLYLFLNGIWVSKKELSTKINQPCMIIANNKSHLNTLILYSLLPSNKVVILSDVYFNDMPKEKKKMTFFLLFTSHAH